MRAHSLVLCAFLTATTACSGGGEPAAAVTPAPAAPEPQVAPTPPPPVAPVVATPDADGIVRLTASDQMRYSATRIEVKAGGKARIELRSAGTLPKEAMGHNLVVLKPGIDPVAFAAKAMAAKLTDYVPAEAAADVLGHTKLLGPGESAILELDALAAGSYPFLCTFPGHVALMNGLLVVQ